MSELSSADPLIRSLAHAPAISLPRVGDRIGRFVIGEPLGAGGMGVVFGAKDEVLGREVAIKVLAVPSATARELVLREARLAATVTHPGVAAIYDVLYEGDMVCLVLERVRGATLREVIARAEPLPREVTIGIALGVLDAVGAAHEAGVLHRDLKPENIMWSERGGVKLLDFGLASAMDQASQSRGGTRRYQAPEAREGHATIASDLYSVGLILQELRTRARGARRTGWPSPRVDRVLGALLADDPALRPPSAREARLALQRASSEDTQRRWLERGVAALLGIVSLSGPATPAPDSPADGGESGARSPEAAAAPLTRIACLPLTVEAPADGWLGAAASNLACRHARGRLGGGAEQVIVAAELAELSVEPSEGAPRDPWADPASRKTAVDRANALADAGAIDAVLDGEVSVDGLTFTVALRLHRGDSIVARGEGRGALAEAAHDASTDLFAAVKPDVARAPDDVEGLDADELDALTFAEGAAVTGRAIAPARRALASLTPRSARATYLDTRLALAGGIAASFDPPPIDRSSDLALASSAALHALGGGDEPPLALADELRLTREHAAGERAELLGAEGLLRLLGGDKALAGSLGLAALLERPATAPWGLLDLVHYGRAEWRALSRVRRAWTPEVADAWNIAAHIDADDVQKGELLRRAASLGDGFPLFAANYGVWLVRAGRLDEARIVMARLGAGQPGQRVAAARIGIDLALAEGRIGAAHETAMRALDTLPSVGSIETGDVAILAHAVELGVLLGSADRAAAEIAERFVLSDPPRLDRGPFARSALAHVCAYAPRDVAVQCFSRLETLAHDRYFPIADTGDADLFVSGAEAFARGDFRAASGFFRRAGAELGLRAGVAALAFERVGDFARADAVDPLRPGPLGGLSAAHLRAMRRALARPLARVLRPTDVETPALREVERALAQCCTSKACGVDATRATSRVRRGTADGTVGK
jgi:hypothetical protein